MKCLLDPVSQSFVENNLSLFVDPLLRQMLWSGLYNSVRDGLLSTKSYVKLVCKHIGNESDPKLIQTIINSADTSVKIFVPNEYYYDELDILFKISAEKYKICDQKTLNEKIIWEKALVSFGCSIENVHELISLLDNPNSKLSQRSRWDIIQKAISWDFPNAETLLQKEKENDLSDAARRAILTCSTSKPDADIKRRAWDKFLVEDSNLSAHERSAEMAGFRNFNQHNLVSEYKWKFFDEVRQIFQTREKRFAESFVDNLFPFEPEDNIVHEKTANLLALLTPEEHHLKHVLKEKLDDLERVRMCRSIY